jgi:hypothetical protein
MRNRITAGHVNYGFTEAHIPYVWDELHDRFGFNVKAWQKLYKAELAQAGFREDIRAVFFRFGMKHINPVLNSILCRGATHNTWDPFVSFVVKKH